MDRWIAVKYFLQIRGATSNERGRFWRKLVSGPILVTVVALAFSAAALVKKPAREPGVLAEFDIAPRGGVITLPVTIGAKTYPFMLDTGAAGYVFDASLRDHLQRQTHDRPIEPTSTIASWQRFRAPAAALGAIKLKATDNVQCGCFRGHFGYSGQDVFGVIGMDVLADKVLSIDFDRGTLRFLESAVGQHGSALEIVWQSDGDKGRMLPHVVLDLGGDRRETFIIDTGYCSFDTGAVCRPTFDQMMANGELQPTGPANAKGLSFREGVVAVRRGQLADLRLGPFHHQNVVLADAFHNCLGLGYLSRYVVTFDFPRSVMYLQPAKEYRRADTYPRAGMTIGRLANKTIVGDFEKGGAGHLAGLQFFDEILAVDGVIAAKTSVFELCRMFTEPRNRKVTFSRDGRKMQTTVVFHDKPM